MVKLNGRKTEEENGSMEWVFGQEFWAKRLSDVSVLCNFQPESTKMEVPGQESAGRPFEKDVSQGLWGG